MGRQRAIAAASSEAGGDRRSAPRAAVGRPPSRGRVLAPLLVCVGALGFAALDEEAGLTAWWHLRGEAAGARARVAALEERVAALHVEIDALRGDPLGVERAIREDLELARPGEWVVRFQPAEPAPDAAAATSADGARAGPATLRFP